MLSYVLVANSDPCSDILAANILRSSYTQAFLSSTPTSARNVWRRMEFSNTQSLSFLDRSRSLTEARRRTYVNGRRIFWPALAKVRSALMDTTIIDYRDPVRAKVVTVSLRELFSMDS